MSNVAAPSTNAGAGAGSGAAAPSEGSDHAASSAAASAPNPNAAAASSRSAAASSAAASSSNLPRLLDLSELTRDSVAISEEEWIRSYPSTLVKSLLQLSAPDAMNALIVYFQADSNASIAFLTDLSSSEVKKVCALLGVPPATRSRDCVAAIAKSIQMHMNHHPHLIDMEAAAKPTASARSAASGMELGYETPPSNRGGDDASSSESSGSSDSEHQ